MSIGSAIVAPTVMRGSNDPYGSWKMICIRRRILRSGPDFSDARSIPSNLTVPAVLSRRRMSARPVVLLPQPDSPTRPSVSPRRMVNEMSSTARTTPIVFCRNPARIGKWTSRPSASTSVGRASVAGISSSRRAVVMQSIRQVRLPSSAPGARRSTARSGPARALDTCPGRTGSAVRNGRHPAD